MPVLKSKFLIKFPGPRNTRECVIHNRDYMKLQHFDILGDHMSRRALAHISSDRLVYWYFYVNLLPKFL